MGNNFNTHFACWGRRGTEQLPRSIGRFFDQIQTGPILVTRQFRPPSQGLLNRLYATDLVSRQFGNDRGRPLICGVENLSEVAGHTLPRSPSNDLAWSRSINTWSTPPVRCTLPLGWCESENSYHDSDRSVPPRPWPL